MQSLKKFGRSGCELSLIEKNTSIRKLSSSVEYNTRLLAQCKKQEAFSEYRDFTKPVVYRQGMVEELYFFDMEYVHGKTFDKFCIESSTNNIVAFVDEILSLITYNLKHSTTTSINIEKFNEKLQQVEKLLEPTAIPYMRYLKTNIPQTLKIGPCHGDLTMSNIVFSDRYYLIDFLDNVFDTPLLDLVKIKQDTEHNFFLNLIDSNHTKVKVCLDYMDDQFNKLFADLVHTDEFVWLSIYNLVRILPYLKNENEKRFLINTLRKYENIITSSR